MPRSVDSIWKSYTKVAQRSRQLRASRESSFASSATRFPSLAEMAGVGTEQLTRVVRQTHATK